nr:TPA_asm: ND4L [Bombus griseocollis]
MWLFNIKLITSFLILNLLLMVLVVMLNSNVYFLNFLIGIEFMMIMILFYMILVDYNGWIFMIYMVYSVCESVLGLSLLVSMCYEYGHQKINFINLI